MKIKTSLFTMAISTVLFMGMSASPTSLAVADAATNRAEFCQEVYNHMVKREPHFTVNLSGDVDNVVENLETVLGQAFDIRTPNNSDDFDYLRWNWKGYSCKTYSDGNGNLSIEFDFVYREPLDRLNAVNARVKQVLPSLMGNNDFETIKNVHDFAVNQITYDETLQRFTAFEGLLENSTVCQGYALLIYKMLTEAGIPVRLMEGYAGEAHAWNIVKLDDKWYCLDATWDDPVTTGKPILRYDYFLVGSAKMLKDHTPEARWNTAEMRSAYPLSETDYDAAYAETENHKTMDDATYEQVNAREEYRQRVVDAYDEATDYNEKSKFAKRALDLQKRIVIAAIAGLSDDSFHKLEADDENLGKVVDLANSRLNAVIIDPLEAYLDSPEFEAKAMPLINKFINKDSFQGLSEAKQAALMDKMTTNLTDSLLEEKLQELSQQNTERLIGELTKTLEGTF